MLSFLLLFFSTLIIAQSSSTDSNNYVLGSGDNIEIKVFGETDLSIETILGKNGTINYPFLGELKITGLTVKQVEELIVKGLKGDYLINPNVYVSINQYRPFFIHGEVNRPGGYPYQPGLTVNQAIALAGGLTERASEDKIFLSNEFDTTKQKNVKLNHQLQAGDTIRIEQSFF